MPLLLVLLGAWQAPRGAADAEAVAVAHARASKAVAALESRLRPGQPPGLDLRYERGGRLYSGEAALSEARDDLRSETGNIVLARVRQWLPPFVVWPAAAVAGLSLLVLSAGALLAWRGRGSREALVRGFSLIRRALPPILGAQVVLAAVAVIAATAFEASAILFAPDLSGGEAKFLLALLILMGAWLWVAGSAVLGLRRALDAFEPEPLPILGRTVTPEEAPGLWRLLDDLAGRLGALRPDNVTVGLTGGFFVASGPKVLEPAGAALQGRTLHLPLPTLAMLRRDEAAAVVAHELAHFSGGDTDYSLRFLPIYAGVERSLHAVATAGAGTTPFLLRPAIALGAFVLEGFHRAVRHWSRAREFAADAAGADATSADAAARALLRVPATRPRIEEALEAAARDPDAAPPDLVAEAVRRAGALGLADPAAALDGRAPHPTDTHPPTRARLEALGRPPGPPLLAEAAAPPAPGDADGLGGLFADPAGLCRAATGDFLAVVRGNRQAYREALETAAAAVGTGEVVLTEHLRGGAIFVICLGLLLAALGAALPLLDLEAMDGLAWGLAGGVGAMGAGLAAWGVVVLRRHGRPFLVLRPDAVEVCGLDAPLRWRDVVQVDVVLQGRRATTSFTLASGPVFPKRVRGGRAVRADAKRRVVVTAAALPRGMDGPRYVELLDRYRGAAEARRRLARGGAVDPWVGPG